ncbi:MAG TPA: DUF2196 domain-containing protein [Symbiobacteriaceae bacterium]|jgi:uncharacterized protein YwbE
MAHEVRANLADLAALAKALQDLQWYTGEGGYRLAGVTVEQSMAVWSLEPKPVAPAATKGEGPPPERRRMVEPGDLVLVETKAQQMARRLGDAGPDGVEGTVFRVLTRGPHPHGMKVELRDRTVGRIKKNLTVPGAGEPSGR